MGDGEGEMTGSDVELPPNCQIRFLLGQKTHTAIFLQEKETNFMGLKKFNFSHVTIIIIEYKFYIIYF